MSNNAKETLRVICVLFVSTLAKVLQLFKALSCSILKKLKKKKNMTNSISTVLLLRLLVETMSLEERKNKRTKLEEGKKLKL